MVNKLLLEDKKIKQSYSAVRSVSYNHDLSIKIYPLVQ